MLGFSLFNITLLKKFSFEIFSDDATRVILKGNEDYINANYINVSLFLLYHWYKKGHYKLRFITFC